MCVKGPTCQACSSLKMLPELSKELRGLSTSLCPSRSVASILVIKSRPINKQPSSQLNAEVTGGGCCIWRALGVMDGWQLGGEDSCWPWLLLRAGSASPGTPRQNLGKCALGLLRNWAPSDILLGHVVQGFGPRPELNGGAAPGGSLVRRHLRSVRSCPGLPCVQKGGAWRCHPGPRRPVHAALHEGSPAHAASRRPSVRPAHGRACVRTPAGGLPGELGHVPGLQVAGHGPRPSPQPATPPATQSLLASCPVSPALQSILSALPDPSTPLLGLCATCRCHPTGMGYGLSVHVCPRSLN